MRFPNLNDLDREQRRVYGKAPNDGAVLVVGAPGTGKTIMAFHRAEKMLDLGQEPRVIMFNKVLARYTRTRDRVAAAAPVSTMNRWVSKWWLETFGEKTPNIARFKPDWLAMLRKVQEARADPRIMEKLHWGHLIVDEGQDFPEDMYTFLGTVLGLDAWRTAENPPALTVFADDNQRLGLGENSSTKKIAFRLGLPGNNDRVFLLEKNYRNTLQIAKLASYFQVGHWTGASKFPDREGPIPLGLFCKETGGLVGYISRRCKANPGKQIGVIVPGRKTNVTSMVRSLRDQLSETNFRVQGYVSGDDELTDKDLDFDAKDTVTIVHYQSAKGLEFDAVYFIMLEELNPDSGGVLQSEWYYM